jgi:hypothetical protein
MIVAWQDPQTRRIVPIGVLSHDDAGYGFAYLESVRDIRGFRPLLGFRELNRQYTSETLFHLFAQRAMSPRRPDYVRYISELGLAPDDDEPWEQLARSHGRREVDRLQLFPVPNVVDGAVRCSFLVHGTRHVGQNEILRDGVTQRFEPAYVERTLSALVAGQELRLEPEPTNSYNPDALLVTASGEVIGWVPDLLLEDLHQLRQRADVSVRVQRINGPEAPAHMRVLAELSATGIDGFEFFAGPRWRTIPETNSQ